MAVLQERKAELLMSASAHLSTWNVPYQRNPFFTGREDLVLSLHSTLTADHPDTAQSLNNLASLYECQGKYAVSLYHRALKIAESLLGSEHPYVTTLRRDYIAVLRKEQFDE
jgi:hypothetical protein